jgi:hypothetical protein
MRLRRSWRGWISKSLVCGIDRCCGVQFPRLQLSTIRTESTNRNMSSTQWLPIARSRCSVVLLILGCRARILAEERRRFYFSLKLKNWNRKRIKIVNFNSTAIRQPRVKCSPLGMRSFLSSTNDPRDIDVASFLKGERERLFEIVTRRRLWLDQCRRPVVRKVSDMSDLHSEDCSIFRADLICLVCGLMLTWEISVKRRDT